MFTQQIEKCTKLKELYQKYEEKTQKKVHARRYHLLRSEIDTFLKIKKRIRNRKKLLPGAGSGHASNAEGGEPKIKGALNGVCQQSLALICILSKAKERARTVMGKPVFQPNPGKLVKKLKNDCFFCF